MGSLTDLIARLRESVAELQALSFAELQFWHRDAADLLAVSLLGLVAVALAVRLATSRRSWRGRVALPAILSRMRRSWRVATMAICNLASRLSSKLMANASGVEGIFSAPNSGWP